MNPRSPDDELRERVRKACREEETAAPAFERVLRGAVKGECSADQLHWWRWWPQLLAGAAAMVLLFAGARQWLRPERPWRDDSAASARGDSRQIEVIEEDEWSLLTDTLLADSTDFGSAPEADRLVAEISALLAR